MDTPLSTGRDAALTCSVAKGDTPMTIEWTFEGRPVGMGSDMGIRVLSAGPRTSFLAIQSVGAAHSGIYTCTATNAVGEASHSARITVKGQLHTFRNPSCLENLTITVSLDFSDLSLLYQCLAFNLYFPAIVREDSCGTLMLFSPPPTSLRNTVTGM